MGLDERESLFMRVYRVVDRLSSPTIGPNPFSCFEAREVDGKYHSIHLRFDGPGAPRWVGSWSHDVDPNGSLAVAFAGAGLLWLWHHKAGVGLDVSMGRHAFKNDSGSGGGVRVCLRGSIDGEQMPAANPSDLLPVQIGYSMLECVLAAMESAISTDDRSVGGGG